MIVNYDKENGKIFLGLKKTIPQISNNVDTLFKNVGKSEKFSDLLQNFYVASNFKNDPFKNWVDGLDSTTKSAMTAGDALDSYKKHLQETAKSTSKLSTITSAAKTAIGTVASVGANMIAGFAIAKIIELGISMWDKYANAQEHAIEAGEEASNKIKENYDKINNAKQWKSTNLERFTELAKGVNASGYNVSLSTAEFSEYQSLASSLADTIPDLVVGFNDLGQPIIRTATNMEQLNQAFRDNDVKQYKSNIKEAQKVIDAFQTQYNEEGSLFKEAGAKQKQAVYKDIIDAYEKSNGKGVVFDLDYKGYNGYALDDALKDIGIKRSTDSNIIKNIDKITEAYEKGQAELEDYASSVRNVLPSFFMVSDEYAKLAEIAPNVGTFTQSFINGLDSDFISKNLDGTKNIKNWANNIIDDLGKSNVQDSINQLFTLDEKKTEMSFKDYESQLNKLASDIAFNVDGIDTADQVKKGLGLDDYITDLSATYEKLRSTLGEDFANTVSIGDYDLAGKILSEQSIDTIEEFTSALEVAKKEADTFSLSSFTAEVNNALSIVDSLNAALANSFTGKGLSVEFEEDKETGLITLKGDIENLRMAYQDLEGYDASTLFEKTANGVHVNREALRQLQAQEEANNKKKWLEDKLKLQTKLNEAIKTQQGFEEGSLQWDTQQGQIDTLRSQIETVELLSSAYDGATSAYQRWINAQSAGEEGDMYRTVSETMKERGAELYKEGRYNTEEFRAIANYFSYEDLSTAPMEKLVEAYEAASNARDKYFTGNKQGIDNFMADMMKVSEKEGKNWITNTEDGFMEFNTGADEEIAKRFNLSKEAVQALFRAATEYSDNIRIGDTGSSEDLDAKLAEVSQKAQEAKDNLKALQEEGKISTDIKFDVDVSELDEAGIDERIDSLQKLKEDAIVKFGADSSEVEYLDQLLTEATLRKAQLEQKSTVGLSVEINNEDDINALGEKLSSLPKDETTNISIAINNEEQLENAVNQVNTIPKDTPVNISFSVSNEEQASALKEQLDAGDKEINYTINYTDNSGQMQTLTKDGTKTVTVNEKQGTTVTQNDESKTVTVNYTLGSQDPPVNKSANVDYNKGKQEDPVKKNANVDYNLGKQDSPSSPKTATVNYILGTVEKPSPVTVKVNYDTSGKPKASGTMLSPSHANGTINTTPAYVNGNVALQKDEKALVNELKKPESIVRDGVWSIIPGGAHIQQLKKGDIIFNGEQTEQLIKHGKIAGHGKAYANGTVSNNSITPTPISVAYTDGSWVFGDTGNGNIGGTGGRPKPSSSSNKKSSKKKSSNSSSSDNAKEFEEVLDWIEIKIDRIERKIKNLERVAGSAFETYANRSKALAEQMGEVSNEITVQQQAYERYLQQANSISLSDDYKTQVQNGTIDISTITDEDLKKNIDDYKQWYEKAIDCKDAVEELTESVKELYQQAFDNIVEEYDNLISQIEHKKDILEGHIDQAEEQGYIVSSKYYNALIQNELENLDKLNKKKSDLLSSINNAVDSGNIKVGSDAWFEMQEEINSVDKAIQEANTSLIEYNNSIRDIQWDVFDKLQDKISGIADESDFLIKLMSNDKLFDDKGNITDKGNATMGLHGVNYNTYMSQADQYRKEMDAIQKEIDADPYNQTLIDRRKELLELQREAIQNAEDEKDAIKDLVEDGIKKQLDSLQDLIDKFNETKRTQQDLYEYEKEVAEQQDKISSIKKRLEAYKNDTSEEGMMNRQELEVELGKAETDLEETQRDKSIQETEKLLNNLLDEYEQVLNMRLDNIDQLISDVIANVNSEAGGIRDTIIAEAEDVGYKLTDSMNTIWGTNGTIATILTSYSNNFSSTMTTVQQAINDIKNYIKDAVNKSDSAANSNTGGSGNNSSSTPPPQPAPQPTPPKPTSPQGDGTPNKGDKVTFVSGNYYYDSYGKRPLGHRYQGQEVYITNINKKGSKPYHISTGNKLGNGDLGWVTLEQLRGYKNGTNAVESDRLAWMNEFDKKEVVIRKKDKAILGNFEKGDAILDSNTLSNLLNMARNPKQFMAQNIGDIDSLLSQAPDVKNISDNRNIQNNIDVNISIDKVQDYNDFIRKFQTDNKFEKLIETIALNKISGRGSLSKFNIKI